MALPVGINFDNSIERQRPEANQGSDLKGSRMDAKGSA